MADVPKATLGTGTAGDVPMLASPLQDPGAPDKEMAGKDMRGRNDTLSAPGRYLANLSQQAPPNEIAGNIPSARLMGSGASTTDLAKKHMTKFLSGFRQFQKTYFASNTALFETLKKTQRPKTVIIGCCDSRVDPALLTGSDPGDLFVIRNVANLVMPYCSDAGIHGVAAALEFAVLVLGVENIIVLGHSKCGGINALLRGVPPNFEFISPWMSIAQRAKEKTLKYFGDRSEEEQQRACEHASILQSIENLITYPWLRERLEKGQLNVTGWYFDFETGDLLGYNPETLAFERLVSEDSGQSPTATRSDAASQTAPAK